MQAMPSDTNAGKTRKKKNKRKSNIKEKIEGKKLHIPVHIAEVLVA